MIPTLGIDISSGDGVVNWQTVASRGITWATIRCTWGCDGYDSRYEQNIVGAGSVGIMPISYHWYKPRVGTPNKQAQWFLSHMHGRRTMIDLEDYLTFKGYHGIWQAELLPFIHTVEGETPELMAQYANKAYIDAYLYDRPEINQRPIVLANWKAAAPAYIGVVETGRWSAWQYVETDKGQYYGTESKSAALYIGQAW